MKNQKGKQGGFTLVELMVGIIILSILGAVFFVATNTDKSKATAIFANISKAGQAFQLSKADLPCYPTRFDVLNTKANATPVNMSCGVDSTAVWRGPYLTGAAFNAAGELDLSSIVTGVTVIVYPWSSVTNVGMTDWRMNLQNVPVAVAQEIMNVCGAKCLYFPPSAPSTTATVTYFFDTTR